MQVLLRVNLLAVHVALLSDTTGMHLSQLACCSDCNSCCYNAV